MRLTRSQFILLTALGVLTVGVYSCLAGAVLTSTRQMALKPAPGADVPTPEGTGSDAAMGTRMAELYPTHTPSPVLATATPRPTPTSTPWHTPTPTPVLPAPTTRYDRQVEEEPDNAALRVERGYAYLEMGAYVYAVEAFDAAIELDAALARAHAGRGMARFYVKEWSAALDDLEQALALDPGLADAHAWHGYLLYLRGEHELAIEAMRWAIALDLGDPAKRIRLAEALVDLGDARAAQVEYDGAVSLDGRSVAAYVGRALARAEQGDLEGALGDLESARRISPFDPLVRDGLARFYVRYQRENLDQAEALARQAVVEAQNDLDRARYMCTLGQILHVQGRPEEALIVLKEAAWLASVEGEIAYHDIAEALATAGLAR